MQTLPPPPRFSLKTAENEGNDFLGNLRVQTVRRITRIGYLVTLREMAIWPPKLGTLYILFSELFLGPKSGLFPQGFAHNTIEQ